MSSSSAVRERDWPAGRSPASASPHLDFARLQLGPTTRSPCASATSISTSRGKCRPRTASMDLDHPVHTPAGATIQAQRELKSPRKCKRLRVTLPSGPFHQDDSDALSSLIRRQPDPSLPTWVPRSEFANRSEEGHQESKLEVLVNLDCPSPSPSPKNTNTCGWALAKWRVQQPAPWEMLAAA